MNEAAQYLPTGAPPDWRVAEEGHPLTALRCSCPEPLLEHCEDGTSSCIWCGREPSVRIGSAPRRPQNGAVENGKSVRRGPLSSLAMNNTAFLGFHAPPDLAGAIKEKAQANERSISGELRVAVRAYLSSESGNAAPVGGVSEDLALREPVNATQE